MKLCPDCNRKVKWTNYQGKCFDCTKPQQEEKKPEHR